MRRAGSALAALALALHGFSAYAGDPGDPQATLFCDPVDGPGRVRCEVEARTRPGDSIAWGDVVLLETPPFAAALRGRIGPHDASVREPRLWRWVFALVARGKGTGDLSGRIRILVCRENSCHTRVIEVTGKVEVGQ